MRTSCLVVVGVVVFSFASTQALEPLPCISSFSRDGVLVCTNLEPGSVATVLEAGSLSGPWATNSAPVSVNVDGALVVTGLVSATGSKFYRVRGVARNATMALIPAGSFTMGSDLDGASIELPLHTVYVSAFYMDKYEVTKALWDEVYNWATNRPGDLAYSFGDQGQGKANNHPVQTVSWHVVVKWCNARSEKEGRVPAYYTDAGLSAVYRSGDMDVANDWVNWSSGYRIPTEAEWEKAARGGASGHRFPWSDLDTISHSRANYNAGDSDPYDLSYPAALHPMFKAGGYPDTSPVGYFAPNGYGLYDMAGNVREWCWDWSGFYSSDEQSDPRGPASGVTRVCRDGGWGSHANTCRTANRGGQYSTTAAYFLGFRCVLPAGE